MEFKKFNKIPRLSRDCIITEKIDGTNAQVYITNFYSDEYIAEVYLDEYNNLDDIILTEEVTDFIGKYCIAEKDNLFMFAGSRKRWITPKNDNYGFAQWVGANSDELFNLGKGHSYGEWWGYKINRSYDMKERVFSLFNSGRWKNPGMTETKEYIDLDLDSITNENKDLKECPKCCRVVPVLFRGLFNTFDVLDTLENLRVGGSVVVPGFMNPEGIIIHHTASRYMFKKTIENDELPKRKVSDLT